MFFKVIANPIHLKYCHGNSWLFSAWVLAAQWTKSAGLIQMVSHDILRFKSTFEMRVLFLNFPILYHSSVRKPCERNLYTRHASITQWFTLCKSRMRNKPHLRLYCQHLSEHLSVRRRWLLFTSCNVESRLSKYFRDTNVICDLASHLIANRSTLLCKRVYHQRAPKCRRKKSR